MSGIVFNYLFLYKKETEQKPVPDWFTDLRTWHIFGIR